MICITFDTDYMLEPWLKQFQEKYPVPGKSTIFCHTYYDYLDDATDEICPHPFINDLSEWKKDLNSLVNTSVHKPIGIRPHSCVYSHMIGIDMYENGYKYISQAHDFGSTKIRPIRHPWGIWELPIYYMDNMDFWMAKNWPDIGHTPFSSKLIDNAINSDELFIFDFHPLHIELNTRTHNDYVDVKDEIVTNGIEPSSMRNEGRGSAVFFEELCEKMLKNNIESQTCSDAMRAYSTS